jgi:site-specific recombinase XerD
MNLKDKDVRKLLLELLAENEEAREPRYPIHLHALLPFQKAMETGMLTGKPFSPHTVSKYLRYCKWLVEKREQVSFETLRQELQETPVEQYAKRKDIYAAILCFGKFLVQEDSLNESFLREVKRIKPKPHKTPKRHCLNATQIEALKGACNTPLNKLIVHILVSTGLRAAEFCNVRVAHINLEEGYLVVNRGKGGKRRRVGLNQEVCNMLREHLRTLPSQEPEAYAFLNDLGQQMTRDGLLNRIRRIGDRAGVQASPHALRRSFVTLNANKGRSLVMLQMACGHADIKTTRSYCQTTEDEVISAMKDWDLD